MSKQNNESKLKYSLSVRVNDTQNELNMEFSFVGDDYPDIAILSSLTKCLGRLLLRSNNTTNIELFKWTWTVELLSTALNANATSLHLRNLRILLMRPLIASMLKMYQKLFFSLSSIFPFFLYFSENE